MTSHSDIQRSALRREDHRLLLGQGRYVADVPIESALSVVIVRSPHAHARIAGIDVAEARQLPGVIGAFSLPDLPELRGALPPPVVPAVSVKPYRQSALADGIVRFAGEPVVAVVANDSYRATDAAARVGVQYEPLPAVIDPMRAADDPSHLVHSDWGTNVAATVTLATGNLDDALTRAPLVVRRRIRCGRLSALPIEPRATVARWDPVTASLHVWSSTQMPYGVRQRVADTLGLAPEAVRVTAPDVGGGFGTKGPVYPEELIVATLARRLGRPVRWTDTRQDSFVSTTHAGDQLHDVTIALDAGGTILALADDFLIDAGAYLPRGGVVANVTATHLVGLYRIPVFHCRGRMIVTHKVPTSPYRGAGRRQATFVAERILDIASRQLGLDPVDVRRKNLIRREEMPYRRTLPYRDGAPMVHDSGDYPDLLETALTMAGHATFRERQQAARRNGRLIGMGVAAYNEATGIGPHEGARVAVTESGRVQVTVGAPSQGQGHETTLAQICATELGVPLASIDVVAGDTALFPSSMGTYASRVIVVVGNAVGIAAQAVRERLARVAARALECDAGDVTVTDGRVHVKGFEDRTLALTDLLAISNRPDVVRDLGEPGLQATRYWSPESVTWAAGVHIATVEVDLDTGRVTVFGYHAVHDAGREINPCIVEGQTQGGAVQGLGAALAEAIVYDEAGQPLTASLMEYALPRADSVPPIAVVARDSPSPLNPLHVKGTGEGSAVPGPAAIANAVADALGVEVLECPIRPETLVRSPHGPLTKPTELR
ncbi:MAG TPA: xanthine dehydrogenase family protein molybdopterin-binding subunit [Candidatus Methylomirabilis sp.]|nr:xanthine dehydrogenase family protein molybdopterin-binding subunit [Candidatus Methylomirabilis sp.]